MSVLHDLKLSALLNLSDVLESHTGGSSVSRNVIRPHVHVAFVEPLHAELKQMLKSGMQPAHIALTLRLLAHERKKAQAISDRVELVWSGLDQETSATRDAQVVLRELFRQAKSSLLIASYAIDKGEKAKQLFGELAERMDKEPDLEVRLFLNVHRKDYKDETPAAVLLHDFASTFRNDIWPGDRLPDVFHDPRALAIGGKIRACLHAKVVVVDQVRALVTSANLTEAAQERNIEAGVVVEDTSLAKALLAQFDTLVDHGDLKKVPGL
jgi:hypothetical protein